MYTRRAYDPSAFFSADEWAGIGDRTPSLYEQAIEDDDLDFMNAMPELSRMRRIERVADPVTTNAIEVGSSSTQDSAKVEQRQSSRVRRGLARARDSFVGFFGARELDVEGRRWFKRRTPPVTHRVSVSEDSGSPSSQPPKYEDLSGAESPYPRPPAQGPRHVAVEEELPDSMRVYNALTDEEVAQLMQRQMLDQQVAQIVQRQTCERIDKRLNAAIARGEFDDEVIAARFEECHWKEDNEEAQWDASYDFKQCSADRHDAVDAVYHMNARFQKDIEDDANIGELPFML